LGLVDDAVVEAFLRHPYFFKMPPKSLDRNDFPALPSMVEGLSDADAAATLTACVAAAVARGAEHFPTPVERFLVTGGGRLNAAMMEALAERLTAEVQPIEAVDLNGDMLEAQAFAYLAMRVLLGLPTSAHYVAAKHGVVGLTKTAAMEYAQDGIRVNCVNPGYVTTPMTARAVESRLEAMMAKDPAERITSAGEVAERLRRWAPAGPAGLASLAVAGAAAIGAVTAIEFAFDGMQTQAAAAEVEADRKSVV
jgi:NAD(P)-dependent dehydrogenase (short-subunit alcohol dehydrogenase family)